MKIAIITHKTRNLAKARKKLIQSLIDKKCEVIGICPEEEYIKDLQNIGVKTKVVKNNRLSINIFGNIKYLLNLVKVLKEEKPDIVFSYTIKPCIIGTLSAKIAKVPRIYSMVTGMGYIYSTDELKVKIIRAFCNIAYKVVFKYNTKVIFQNKEDKEEFIKRKFIDKSKAFIVDGSGVDMEKFKKSELPSNFNFLMVARTLKVKGVKEFCEAANIVKNKYENVTFTLVGEIERNSRGINVKEIENYKNIVNFEGYKENILPYLKNCKVFVLPSYLKEGIPRTLLEALAVGRPIITTNLRGCKETVKVNENGLLVKPKDVNDLVEKMEYMIKNENELKQMAECSYNYAKERFDINIINKKMLEIMEIENKQN